MKKYIIVEGDTNDADYIRERTLITDKELKELKPIIKAIKSCKKDHNWSNEYSNESVEEIYKGMLTEDQLELFEDYVPHGEYGVHTITSIILIHVVKETELL